MTIKYLQSPNLSERRQDAIIDTIVIHHTNMDTLESAVNRLCDREAEVSAHYVIAKDGVVYLLVPEEYKAWHCGASHWRGRDMINDYSIGIELENQGFEPFPEEQIDSLIDLCRDIMKRHAIEQRNIIGHSDIAPLREDDPHRLFPWKFLAENGIGIFPDVQTENNKITTKNPDFPRIIEGLSEVGYYVNQESSKEDRDKVIKAFKRHFCPEDFPNDNNHWDSLCESRLNKLREVINGE